MHYQLCPKCNGQGVLSKPPWGSADIYQWTTSQASFVCDVCGGNKTLLVPDSPEVLNNYLQVDEDSFIPIVNIGGSVRGKYRKRPKEMYIRATRETIENIFKSETTKEQFFKWLSIAVLPAFEKEIK